MKKTKSAGGVVVRSGFVLVVSQHGTSWSLPKGHVEKGENLIEAARREISEEAGIRNLELVKKLGSYKRYRISKKGRDDKQELKEIHMLLFRTNEKKLKPVDIENPEAKWVKKAEVANLLTHKKDKEFFLKIIGKI